MVFVSYLTKGGEVMKERNVAFEIKLLDNMITRKICESVKQDKMNNISHVQAKILKFLYKNRNGVIFQSDVEKEIGARRSTVSGILKTMEKNGLIVKQTSKNDTRKKEIVLTDKSIKKHAQMKNKVAQFETFLIKNISYEELGVFFKVMDKLKENLK